MNMKTSLKSVTFIIALPLVYSNFLSNEFSEVERSVSLSGFHRFLLYHVIIHNTTGSTNLLIEQNIPSEIYVDPYQLSSEIKHGKIKISDADKINIEEPAYQAKPISIQLCSQSTSNVHKLHLPIHIRYQKPHSCNIFGPNVTVGFKTPVLYFRKHTSNLSNDKCHLNANHNLWTRLKTVELQTNFEVPVGCIEHFFIVFVVTNLVVFAGTVSFIIILFKKI